MVSWVSCGPCGGNGSVMSYGREKCDDCNGIGQVYEYQQPGYYPNDVPRQPGYKICAGCSGSGLKSQNYKYPCARCHGRGATLEQDDQDIEPHTPGPIGPRELPPHFPPPPDQTYKLNWLGKSIVFLIKAGIVYLVLRWVLSISVINNFAHSVPDLWGQSGAKEALQRMPEWFAADARAPAKAIGYPPVKGVWAGRIECGKVKGEARLSLNGPVIERVEAPFQIKWGAGSHAVKHTLKLEGRIVKDKLRLEGSSTFNSEGYYAAQVVIAFEDFRPTGATGTLGAPGCEAARFTLRRER